MKNYIRKGNFLQTEIIKIKLLEMLYFVGGQHKNLCDFGNLHIL